MDYNNAGAQRSFDIIPDGTIVVAQMNIRPGGAGEDGFLKRSKDGGCEMLDVEFTVVEGEYATLIGKAMLARDAGEKLVTRRLPLGTAKQEDWDDKLPTFEK
jgi:hypothetical protein